jgi:uncharacterized protein (DUF1015 family)
MSTIKPFEAYFIRSDHAREVVSPACDTLTPAQRYDYATRNPRNYLNVIRAPEEFPAHIRPPRDELLASNAAKLKELVDLGVYIYTDRPCFFIYRLSVDGHVQTGLIAEMPVEAYDDGVIRKHENTRQDKEDQLTRYQEAVGASSSPVCLAYEERPEISNRLTGLTCREPVIDFVSDDGVAQSIWCIDDARVQRELTAMFAEVPVAYLTDGHHRCAAGSRYASKMRAKNSGHTGDEPYNFLLVALFPDTEMRILPYNRCIKDLNGCSVEGFLGRLKQTFEVEPLAVEHVAQAEPVRRREMAMFLENRWYRLMVKPYLWHADDPVGSLDVMILHDHILKPLLGINDPRTDRRIQYMAGTLGIDGLQAQCSQAGWRVGFAVYPTSIDQLKAVADANKIMPPKSTCFYPKARSGLFVRMR